MRLLAATAILLVAASARAHDFWIEPSTFHPTPGATVSVALRAGQHFIGEPVPRMSPLIERFVVRQGGDEEEMAGIENTDPAGFFRADGRGTAVIAYQSRSTFVQLPAGRFEDYLREYGLQRIIDARTRRGERAKPGYEIFSRCAKSLLAGRASSSDATKPIGLRYEIVPDADPTYGNAPFRGRLLYEGRPLPGALLTARLHGDPQVRLTARSSATGAFTFPLPRPGIWLITSVQMADAPRGSKAEWESVWASLTFERR
jgi:uncharacterized GH25 family protein